MFARQDSNWSAYIWHDAMLDVFACTHVANSTWYGLQRSLPDTGAADTAAAAGAACCELEPLIEPMTAPTARCAMALPVPKAGEEGKEAGGGGELGKGVSCFFGESSRADDKVAASTRACHMATHRRTHALHDCAHQATAASARGSYRRSGSGRDCGRRGAGRRGGGARGSPSRGTRAGRRTRHLRYQKIGMGRGVLRMGSSARP